MAVNNNTDTKAQPLETEEARKTRQGILGLETDCKYGNETK